MIAQECHTISTRVEVSLHKMSNSWDMRKGIGNPQGPNGEYNKPYTDGVNAKRIRSNLWPSGKFNDQEGPLSALQNSDSSMRSMSKNLTTNQTVMTLYINIPRLVVPINIPHMTDIRNLSVAKCIGAGDVVFQLRYNDVMLKSGDATQVTNRYMPDLVYCANLATINYLLFGIQTLLSDIYKESILPNGGGTLPDFQRLWAVQKQYWKDGQNGVHNSTTKIRSRWFHFLNVISTGDFAKMMQEGFFEGYAALVDFARDSEALKKRKYSQFVDSFLWDFINTYAKIGGIFIGSDNQGGAQYGDPNPSSYAPTDFVGVLQVAGKNFKVRNMWSACQGGTSSGDILGFKLKFFPTKATGEPPLTFRLSSNSITQKEETVNISQSIAELGGYSLLVPAKMKRNTVRADLTSVEERDDGFLQFGICDQISKPSNIFNSAIASACDATASVVPAPSQIYMRLGYTRLPKQHVVAFPTDDIPFPRPLAPPAVAGGGGGALSPLLPLSPSSRLGPTAAQPFDDVLADNTPSVNDATKPPRRRKAVTQTVQPEQPDQ